MNWRIVLSFAFLCAFVSPVLAQDKPAKSDANAKTETLELAGGKVIVNIPGTWKTMTPRNQMIANEYRFPIEGDKSARITFSVAGGSIDSNIDRWITQFDGAKKEDAKIEKKEISGIKVNLVELEGTFKDSMGPGSPVKKLESHRLLGVILEIKDGPQIFIKATGPKEIIADMKEGFIKMVDGLKSK